MVYFAVVSDRNRKKPVQKKSAGKGPALFEW
jgi:hypothetical protein